MNFTWSRYILLLLICITTEQRELMWIWCLSSESGVLVIGIIIPVLGVSCSGFPAPLKITWINLNGKKHSSLLHLQRPEASGLPQGVMKLPWGGGADLGAALDIAAEVHWAQGYPWGSACSALPWLQLFAGGLGLFHGLTHQHRGRKSALLDSCIAVT